MASLAASGVTVVRKWREGGLMGKERLGMRVKVTLSSMGTITNAIPASAFGLSVMENVSNAIKSDNAAIVPAALSADGTKVVLANLAQATDANRIDPADLTGDYYLTLAGYE